MPVPEDAPLVILDPELHLQWTDKAEAIEPAAAEQADAPSEAASDDELDDCSLVFSTKVPCRTHPDCSIIMSTGFSIHCVAA